MNNDFEFLGKVLFNDTPIEERIKVARTAILELDSGLQQAYTERLNEIEELLKTDPEDDEDGDDEEEAYWRLALVEEELEIDEDVAS